MCFANANFLRAQLEAILVFRDAREAYPIVSGGSTYSFTAGLGMYAGCPTGSECMVEELENCLVDKSMNWTFIPITGELTGPRGTLTIPNNFGTPNIAEPGETVRLSLLNGGPYGSFTQDLLVTPRSRWLLPQLPPDPIDTGMPWLERRRGTALDLAWEPVQNSIVIAHLDYTGSSRYIRAKCYYDGSVGRGTVPAALFTGRSADADVWGLTLSTTSGERIVTTNAGPVSVGAYSLFYRAVIRAVP